MVQVQCPNCGGYKVTTKAGTYDRRTGKGVSNSGCAFGGGLFSLGAYPIVNGIAMISNGDNNGIGSLVVGLSIEGLAVWSIVLGISKYRKTDMIKKYKHECLLDGYRWERREDEPPPEVHVRPDLIAMGEQRLAEERRRQEEAAAAHFLEQQRRNK